jgi:HlyD family secretion protein
MRKWLLRLSIPIAVAALLFFFTVYRDEPIAVRVVPVERAVVEATITNSKAGTIRARRRARLSAEVGARIVAIAKREGEWVKDGEVILRMNDSSPRAQLRLSRESLRVAEAARREACIARDRALRELNRKRALAQENIMSEDLLDALESTHNAAEAACVAATAEKDRARAAIAAAEADLAKFAIRAPFAGVIAEMTAEIGEWITPSPPLLTAPAVVDIIDPSSLYVSAPMDEVDSHPNLVFSGRVVRVAPYVLDIEAQNRTVEVEVEFEEDFAATLLPGTSADIEVILEIRDDVLRVPTSALLEGRAVLLPNDGRLVEREVEVGLKNWDWAEITEGLEEGQRVVISLDRAEVKAGARVEVEATTVRP